MTMDTSLLGLLSLVIMGWIRELRARLTEAVAERNAALKDRDFWREQAGFIQRGYDLVASLYLKATRNMPNAEPLPFDPNALDRLSDQETRR